MKASMLILGAIALTVLAAGLTVEPAAASNKIAKAEDLACTSCHDKPGSKLLTDRGKYFELMGALEGYDELSDRFARCTSCHVRKPGSPKLTSVGRKYRWMMSDMEGLKDWLMEQHPAQPVEPAETAAEGSSK